MAVFPKKFIYQKKAGDQSHRPYLAHFCYRSSSISRLLWGEQSSCLPFPVASLLRHCQIKPPSWGLSLLSGGCYLLVVLHVALSWWLGQSPVTRSSASTYYTVVRGKRHSSWILIYLILASSLAIWVNFLDDSSSITEPFSALWWPCIPLHLEPHRRLLHPETSQHPIVWLRYPRPSLSLPVVIFTGFI